MASTYLQRTPSSTGNRDKWTWSAWVKRSKLGANITLFSAWADSSNNSVITFLDDDALRYYDKAAGSVQANLYTNRKFRDTNSWYHIVVVYDSGNNTSGDRVKIYVNGVEETSFSTDTMPGQNNDSTVNKASCPHYIGTDDTTGYFFDGAMSHIHFIDGTAYDASAFGETDTTTGEWKAKTSPSVTYGTNGFLILKDGNTITDQSSNSNDFTLGGGTLTDLKDNPDNVFATINSLVKFQYPSTYSNGNNTVTPHASGSGSSPFSTLAVSSGKYYAELKIVTTDAGHAVGIIDLDKYAPDVQADEWFYRHSYGYGYQQNGQKFNNNSGSAYGNSFTDGDILGIALDLDNNKLYFSKNGTWQNSGDPTSGSTGTGSAFDIANGTYAFTAYGYYSDIRQWNFGNGYFGTTAITTNSGNGYSGAEGSSKFNYTVPTGYSALSTKGLNL